MIFLDPSLAAIHQRLSSGRNCVERHAAVMYPAEPNRVQRGPCSPYIGGQLLAAAPRD